MGVELQGNGGWLDMTWSGWHYCFEIAHKYGWKPKGTCAPDYVIGAKRYTTDPAEWNGSYFVNEFQMVTDDDARALAEALRRAIAGWRGPLSLRSSRRLRSRRRVRYRMRGKNGGHGVGCCHSVRTNQCRLSWHRAFGRELTKCQRGSTEGRTVTPLCCRRADAPSPRAPT
jgi:hypothetical protein